ncbi:hypothetical protein [Streptomyces nigra]
MSHTTSEIAADEARKAQLIDDYQEAMGEYEAACKMLRDEYETDPLTPEEWKNAKRLFHAGYLNHCIVWRPFINDAGEVDGTAERIPPSRTALLSAAAEMSFELFGDDQGSYDGGMELNAGEIQNADKMTHLFYSGVMNSIFGDRSAGKTWLALALARDFIQRGQHVAWLNFEAMLGSSLRGRLRAMGVEESTIATYFHAYDRPDEAPAPDEMVGLVIIDAVDPCLSHMGRNTLNDGAAVDEMAKRYFYPYQEMNPYVTGLSIDHVGNSNDKRESGSRRKQHYTQGVKYLMASRIKSRKGTKGYAALALVKDNNGEVPFDDGQEVAYVALDSTHDVEHIDVLITAVEPLGRSESVAEQTQRKSARTDALRIIREAGGVIDRDEYNTKMQAAGYTLNNARTQLSRLKSDHLITVEENVISVISTD